MVDLALEYSDTVKIDRPVSVIFVFNSDKDFIPNEISQDDEIYKSCLTIIGIDLKNRKPIDFIFYNKKGKRVYWGDRWMPDGPGN